MRLHMLSIHCQLSNSHRSWLHLYKYVHKLAVMHPCSTHANACHPVTSAQALDIPVVRGSALHAGSRNAG